MPGMGVGVRFMNVEWRFMHDDAQDTLPSPRAGGERTRLDKAVGAVEQVDVVTRVLEGLNDDVGEEWAARRADGRTIDVRLEWMDDDDEDRDRPLFDMPAVSEEVGSADDREEGGEEVSVGARGSQPQFDLPEVAGALPALTTLTAEQVTNAMRSVDVYYSNPLNLRAPAGRPVAGTLHPSRVIRGETGLVELRRPARVLAPSEPHQQQPSSPDVPRPSARPWLRPNQPGPTAETVPPPTSTAGADPLVPSSALAARPGGGGRSPRKERALLLEAETRAVMGRVSANVIEVKNKEWEHVATMLSLKVKKAKKAAAATMTPGTAAGGGVAAGAGAGVGWKGGTLLAGGAGVLVASSSRRVRGTKAGTIAVTQQEAGAGGRKGGGGGGGGRRKTPTSKPVPASFLLFKQFCENGGGVDGTGAMKEVSVGAISSTSSTGRKGGGGSPAPGDGGGVRWAQSPRLPLFLANVR